MLLSGLDSTGSLVCSALSYSNASPIPVPINGIRGCLPHCIGATTMLPYAGTK